MHSPEQGLALQVRATAVFSFANAAARDEKFVRAPRPQHFRPHQDGSYNDGMNSIHTDGINGMEVNQRFTILPAESHVVTHLSDSSARFHSPDHVAPRQMLMLQTHFRSSKNPNVS
jgi:hypothetical protein